MQRAKGASEMGRHTGARLQPSASSDGENTSRADLQTFGVNKGLPRDAHEIVPELHATQDHITGPQAQRKMVKNGVLLGVHSDLGSEKGDTL